MYPVNSIGFNVRNKKFLYTAGSEGNLFFWDYEAKNKVKSFHFNNVPISATKMSPDGNFLAYALGYDWHKGYEGMDSSKPRLCVHYVKDAELKY